MTSAGTELRLTVNGETHELRGPMTVSDLLAHFGVDTRQVAVERNRALVRRGEFDATELASGDEIEIVTFVGGG